MIKVAITGVIGSGKSYVGELLVKAGYKVLDLDKVAKQVRENEAKTYIKGLFKTTSKKRIAELVYDDPSKLNDLNRLMHPLILKRMRHFFKAHTNEAIVFVEVPLLYELGWQQYFDYAWGIKSNEETILERLINQRGLSEQLAIKISENQLSNDLKIAKSDFVINNNKQDTCESIQKQIREGINKCLKR